VIDIGAVMEENYSITVNFRICEDEDIYNEIYDLINNKLYDLGFVSIKETSTLILHSKEISGKKVSNVISRAIWNYMNENDIRSLELDVLMTELYQDSILRPKYCIWSLKDDCDWNEVAFATYYHNRQNTTIRRQ